MRRVVRLCKKLAPPSLASPWDNVGLIVGDAGEKCRGVVVALDVTHEVIDLAVKEGCNLIIAHHPPIFAPIKKIEASCAFYGILQKLIKHDIAVYAMHTNLDFAPKGLNRYVAGIIGFRKIRAVTDSEARYIIGALPKSLPAYDFARVIKNKLGLKQVRVYGPDVKIETVALCTGSGADLLAFSAARGADALVTGDVRHHHAIDAKLLGITLIDAGHIGTERPMIELVADYLKKNLTKLSKRIKITASRAEELFMDI